MSDTYFTGDADGLDPQEWIQGVELAFKDKWNDDQKVRRFQLLLKKGSQAYEWYTNLAKPITWPNLETAFQLEWPAITVTQRTREEKIAELRGYVITNEELGKKENVNGLEVPSHVRWVNRMETLVKIDTGNMLMGEVRDKLPVVLKDKVPSNIANWATFLDIIRKLQLTDVLEAKKKEDEIMGMRAQIQSLQNTRQPTPLSPMANLQQQFARQSLYSNSRTSTTGQATANMPNVNQFGRQTTTPAGNTFYNQAGVPAAPRFQRTQADRAAEARRNALPHHPDTPAGQTAYRAQLATWAMQYPDGRVNEYRQYPLKPGGAAVASGECFCCGKVASHRANDCTDAPVPLNERQWRAIANRLLRPPRDTAPVNNVGVMMGAGEWVFVPSPVIRQEESGGAYITEEGQGNATGPSI